MGKAPIARWLGDNYQARIFWLNALNLLEPTSCVSEVTFEADGPRSFDDFVVKYDPPVPRSGPERVVAEYHQVKWHVTVGGRFGYESLIDPEFIDATAVSLLKRLQQARQIAPKGSRFAFITTDRVADNDPLGALISGNDHSLLVEKLFDGTTDRSKRGKVRKLWREHLGLKTNEDLRQVLTGLRIVQASSSLDDLREQVNVKARAVGLVPVPASTKRMPVPPVVGRGSVAVETQSDFRFDELARQLAKHELNSLTPVNFAEMCRNEGLLPSPAPPPAQPDAFLPIAIRSFLGLSADIVGAMPDDTLLLTDEFRQRYLRDDRDWQRDIRPRVEDFLRKCARTSPKLRLILDVHASLAFLAGMVLDLKSSIEVQLVQKGRLKGIWSASDGHLGPPLEVTPHPVGRGREVACAVSITQNTLQQALDYVAEHLPDVGTIVEFMPPGGPSQRAVAGGEHACALADQISNAVRQRKAGTIDAAVHIFAACPNGALFYLGQQHQSIAPCIVYEYDFDQKGSRTYQPSFRMG